MDSTDRAALIALYCSTGGPSWAHNVGWNTDAELSTWYGVQVNDQGRVVSLSLSANNLKGHIPKQLGNLSHLETLFLGVNQLSGHIPCELGKLSHLRILSLRENQLSGPIPEEIGTLSELSNLWLSGNQFFSGHIPCELGKLSHLETLSLEENQLSGYIPPGLGALRQLQLNDLSASKDFESDWDAAEKEIEEAAGPDRPASDTMMPHSLGNSREAGPLNARSQTFYQKPLGSEHPDMAIALNNQALLLSEQGEFTEAEMLYAQSQTIYEKSLGSEHPLVATALSNRANLLNKQGMYAEAEPLYERSQTIIEKALGPEHPLVATTLSANLLSKQGKYEEADPLYLRAIEIGEKTLGTFLNDQGVLMGTQRSQMPDEELLSPLKKDRIILDILDKFVASPETDKTHESFTGQPALTGDTTDEPDDAEPDDAFYSFMSWTMIFFCALSRYMRKVLQHRSSSSYIHRTAEVANRKGSATRSSTMLGILAATVFMPGVAAAETYGGIIDLVMYARERWCNVHVSLHVVAIIMTGFCLFKSVVFAIGEIKAGLAELAEALQEARQAKHAVARPQHHTASRARSKA